MSSALRSHLLLAATGHGAAAQTGPGSAGTEAPLGYVAWYFPQAEEFLVPSTY